MAYDQDYFQKNRDAINKRRRENYNSENRRDVYTAKKSEILSKLKQDRTKCNLCHFDFRTSYLKKHLLSRQKLSEEYACQLCS